MVGPNLRPPESLPSTRRIVVAHRGASGYAPEHTLVSYAMAHALGADYIEPDVVLTRDLVPLCLHDLYLEATTNVSSVFPDRRRVDGHWYAMDLTLAEIRSLSALGRASSRGPRPPWPHCSVPTLEELILLIQGLNRTTGRQVGLVIETKDPAFHQREGQVLEPPLLEVLQQYGYRGPGSLAIIQSFDAAHLQRIRQDFGSDLPLMLLTNRSLSPQEWDDAFRYAQGVNPNRRVLESASGIPNEGARFVQQAHDRGLKVFVWTFDDEEAALRRFFWDYGIDGAIANHPDVAIAASMLNP